MIMGQLIWQHLIGLGVYRSLYLHRAPKGPMADFYARKFPRPGTPVKEVEFVALDFETTALTPGKGEIVSAGWVVIRNLIIDYASARYFLVKTERPVTEASAVIHGITDDALQHGVEPDMFLTALMADLSGRVLLAHHAGIEKGFLRRYCQRLYHFPFRIPHVDTLLSEKRRIGKSCGQEAVRGGMLRLNAARARYNLPRYKAHNALTDAIACAELFLAQLAYSDPRRNLVLRDVLG